MSALPPISDISRTSREVRFGPKADSCTAAILSLFDHQVGAAKQRKQHGKAESDARHHAPSLRNALRAKNGRRPIVDVRRFGSDFEFEADLHDLCARDLEIGPRSLGVVMHECENFFTPARHAQPPG